MSSYTLSPSVQQAKEFLEISRDFTNPLEAVREAISNSFDAGAKLIQILFQVEPRQGEGVLEVVFQDNGSGMDREGLQSFFDLGNSLSREKDDAIGEKGHGTKVFLGCETLTVETVGPDQRKRRAVMQTPLSSLHDGVIPTVAVSEDIDTDITVGTHISLRGFNRNRRDIFTHEQLKDYVLWFTKFGAIDLEFKKKSHSDRRLLLKGVDLAEPEEISFGHVFGRETTDRNALFDEYETDAPKYFCRKWVRTGTLRNHPEIEYHAVFVIEGDAVKRSYNDMITRPGVKTRTGMYKVTDRYGLYLCRDFIPIERVSGWLGTRSTDHLLYHAFINCQGLHLTANRSSIRNTPQPVMEDLREVTENIRKEIIDSDEYEEMSYLQEEAVGYDTLKREEKQYKKRKDLFGQQRVASYKGAQLIEPRQESGVFALTTAVMALEPSAFPFEIVDYDTSIGIDALVKTRDTVPIAETELRYAEFKFVLEKRMNHSFRHMYCAIVWDIHRQIKHETEVEDVTGEKRLFRIIPPKRRW